MVFCSKAKTASRKSFKFDISTKYELHWTKIIYWRQWGLNYPGTWSESHQSVDLGLSWESIETIGPYWSSNVRCLLTSTLWTYSLLVTLKQFIAALTSTLKRSWNSSFWQSTFRFDLTWALWYSFNLSTMISKHLYKLVIITFNMMLFKFCGINLLIYHYVKAFW